MLVKKEVARPGEVWYTDPGGSPRLLTVTGGDEPFDGNRVGVKYWHRTGQAMLGDGLYIPVPLEHDKTLHAMTPSERAAKTLTNNAGQVLGYELEADGRLFANLDLADHKIDPKDIGSTVKWTSPWVNSFTDGNGKKWDGVITHLALTTRPRIIKQEPFPSIAAALSLAKPEPPDLDQGFAISRAGLVKEGKPVYPVAFSLYSGVHLASEDFPKKEKPPEKPGKSDGDKSGDMPPKKEKSGEDGEGERPFGKEGGESKPKFDPNTGEPIKDALVDPDGDIPVFQIICDLFEMLEPPITVGEGVTAENFAERVYTALMDTLKSKGNAMPQEPLPDQTPKPVKPGDKPNPVVQEQAPLMMSLERAQAIPDPALRELALSLLSQKDETEALKKNAYAHARRKRDERIERLCKCLPQDKRDKLLAMAKGAEFSLQKDGAVSDPLDDVLDILEAGVKNLPEMLLNNSVTQPHPREYDGTLSDERAAEIAEELATRGGHAQKPAA